MRKTDIPWTLLIFELIISLCSQVHARFLVDCTTSGITASTTAITVCNKHYYEAKTPTAFPYPAGLFTFDPACFDSGVVISSRWKTGPETLPSTRLTLVFTGTGFTVATGSEP